MNNSNTLVFRWVGKHIEGKLRKGSDPARLTLSSANRAKYIKLLHETLEQGLYAQAPQGDSLGDGFFQTTLPCLCFTESSVRSNLSHCHEYGRMAFGFTKQFVAKHGGGPVHYTLGTQKDIVSQRLQRLHTYFAEAGLEHERKDLDYITHFFKRLRPEIKSKKGEVGHRVTVIQRRLDENGQAIKYARYPRLVDLPYLKETEWRLVCPVPVPTTKNARWHSYEELNFHQKFIPNAKFHITPGSELQTVILPDNRTLQEVFGRTSLTNILFKSGRPPVQLISLEGLTRLP